ncbi:putative serine protease K12H4.7 [Oppia nitens]|uniref:putative serine protease K12H4.7 n=1 Tax=Oppia nitens TaxID=1686743 RepID=UPI0023DAAC8C|nr:putative serine protease K12H4.7 [Oppia nitens]
MGSVYKYGNRKSPVPDNHIQKLPDNWFDQRVDHFNTNDTRTFKQRYFLNNKYYKTGGPVFLLVDGENEGQDYLITKGAVSEYANRFNALLVDLEHRYYGQSVPTKDLSVENMQYLTVGQALKDTEQFIGYLNRKLSLNNNTTKWIAFGGSYAGNLVAFLREKYPHAVAGSVASSAPVQVRYDYKEYFVAVSKSLGTECSNQIRLAVNQLENQLRTPIGWEAIGNELNLCSPLNGTDKLSVKHLMFGLTAPFTIAAQYNGRANTIGVDQLCALMTNGKDVLSPLQRYAKVVGQYFNGQCIGSNYSQYINIIKDISIPSPAGWIRQWTYQMCTEFGYFWTTDDTDTPFGHNIPIEYYLSQCADIFGKQFTPQFIQKAIDRFNDNYGGFKLNVTNVVFPNGAVDPYHELSIVKDLNNSTRAILMKTTGHGADMDPTLFTDPRELTDARLAIQKQIQLFLQ